MARQAWVQAITGGRCWQSGTGGSQFRTSRRLAGKPAGPHAKRQRRFPSLTGWSFGTRRIEKPCRHFERSHWRLGDNGGEESLTLHGRRWRDAGSSTRPECCSPRPAENVTERARRTRVLCANDARTRGTRRVAGRGTRVKCATRSAALPAGNCAQDDGRFFPPLRGAAPRPASARRNHVCGQHKTSGKRPGMTRGPSGRRP